MVSLDTNSKINAMDRAEQILEKHINANDLNFIFHEKKDLWEELLNAVNEALGLAHVVGRSEPCGLLHSTDWNGKCFKCGEQVFVREPK